MSFEPALRNTEYIFYTSLVSQTTSAEFQVDPTLEEGDVTISIDGSTEANLATLPVVEPSGSKNVKVVVSAGEMDGLNIVITFHDQTGAEWADQQVLIQTTLAQFDDISTDISEISTDISEIPTDLANDVEFLAAIKDQIVEALNTDTYSEIGQETPAATQSIRKMIAYLYKSWRNKKTQTATEFNLFADDGTTVDHKSTVSDSSGTTTVGEIVTGP